LIKKEVYSQEFSPDDAQEGVNKPPMHPNCRCVIQPVMDGETKDEIVRRGRDEGGKGTVMPPGMSYKEWKDEYGTVAKNATVDANLSRIDASGTRLPLINNANRINMVTPNSANDAFKNTAKPPIKETVDEKIARFNQQKATTSIKELNDQPPYHYAIGAEDAPRRTEHKEMMTESKITESLTQNNKLAIRDYSGEGYIDINSALGSGVTLNKNIPASIVQMDDAFSKSETGAFTVFSSVSRKSIDPDKLIVGDFTPVKPYISASSDIQVARNFGVGTDRPMVVIHSQAGHGHAMVLGELSAHRSENEVLMNRGLLYKVLNVGPKSNKYPNGYVELEVFFG